MYKPWLSGLAIALTLVAFIPYIRSILKEKTKPHVFSWVIWGTTTFIVFLAQLQDGGGYGAWPTGLSGLITLYVALLAFIKTSDSTITALDWFFFITALSSLPFWYFTDNPLWAVIILTTVDILGFGPTVRKAYHHPLDENILFYAMFTVRNLLVIMALQHYSLTTILFPAAIALACLVLIIMLIIRRKVVFNPE